MTASKKPKNGLDIEHLSKHQRDLILRQATAIRNPQNPILKINLTVEFPSAINTFPNLDGGDGGTDVGHCLRCRMQRARVCYPLLTWWYCSLIYTL
jgi:hypothetical protein